MSVRSSVESGGGGRQRGVTGDEEGTGPPEGLVFHSAGPGRLEAKER